ncbi:MAG: DUF1697 domain-containing protein [Chloroflexota bacterium]
MARAETKYAAFFRNVNLGQGINPTRVQLESAFTDAGAASASSFITSGNVVFATTSETKARKVLASAREILKSLRGLKEPAFLRSLPYLSELAASDPFTSMNSHDIYDYSITFLDVKGLEKLNVPLKSLRGDLEIFRFTNGEALSVSHEIDGKVGNATAFLEKLLDVQVTTRNWNTIVRIVKRFA